MFTSYTVALLLASLGLVAAAPASAASAAASCTVTSYSNLAAAVSSCTAITLQDLAVPAGDTLDLTKLKAGTKVTFAGKTTFGYVAKDYDMIKVSGTNIEITGASGHVIDGNGSAWWDGKGSNGGTTKPDHFFVVSKLLGTSHIHSLNIQNWPTHCFSISGSDNLVLENLNLDNTAGDASNSKSSGKAAAHNSDGFDLSSSDNVILRNSVVKNQDDCVAVTSGTNVTVSGMTCSGGHGLSIGSVGGKSDNTVSGITFTDSTVSNSENGIRIKTNSGTTGSISNIVYKNIKLSGITTYGLDVQQDYLNGGPTGTPTNGVPIKGLTVTNVTGTVASGAKGYYILCASGACTDFVFNDVSITGGKGDSCNVTPTGNFKCT